LEYSYLNFDQKVFRIVIGYEMKIPRLQAKVSAMRAGFQQAASWIDQLPLEKWTHAYD